jgi:glycosyltransferase involved in cell wall biosynthesis
MGRNVGQIQREEKRMSTKRALVCAPRVPEFDRESGSRRIFHLIEFLQEAGWTVCFVAHDSAGSERYVRLLQQRGVETWLGFGSQVEELIAARRFDLAILAFWHLAEKCMPAIRRFSPNTRVIVDMIDLHFLRDARRILRARSADANAGMLGSKYASEMIGEINVYATADAVLAVSQKEADMVNDLAGDPTLASVVPDSEDLPASTIPFEKRNGILFIGNFWHQPNVGAAEYLCTKILPLLDPALAAQHPVYIVGNELNDAIRAFGKNLPGIRFVGWVPSVLPYLNRARVSVIPLLTGAGTKRKLIQALMTGTPTVSTSIGVEGLHLTHEKHVLVADDPLAFAERIGRLLSDAELWEALSHEGRQHVMESHGHRHASTRLMQVIDEVLLKTPKPLMTSPSDRVTVVDTPARAYQKLVARVREVTAAALPDDATVMVVSNGDDDLLKLGDRKAWHFPQSEDGRYAGYHPANSADAIAQLEKLREKGGDYLIFPGTSSWWLDYYKEFKAHLEKSYALLCADEACSIFSLRASEPARPPRPEISKALSEVTGNGRSRRKKVLVLGVYLAAKPNNVADIVSVLGETGRHTVTQRWIALGGKAPAEHVGAVTVGSLAKPAPKFQIVNELLAAEKLSQYEYVMLMDDDIVLPNSFLDSFINLQERLSFAIAQPARTSNSYIDHPIVEQQQGVLARRTLFVEIGPVVSFHRSAYALAFPFDLTSPMGWGYENVWAFRIERAQMRMGIIDAVPVDHSLRKPVANYSWDEANRQRNLYLSQHEHLPLDECFRVLDVITPGLASHTDGHVAVAH